MSVVSKNGRGKSPRGKCPGGMSDTPLWGIPLILQWCVDMRGSGRRRAGPCCLTCDGGGVCAMATQRLISCVYNAFSYIYF